MLYQLLFPLFLNLEWGLPYPFHPDERNMADAITRLTCDASQGLSACMEPGFYSYGQLPINLGWVFAKLSQAFLNVPMHAVSYTDAAWGLRASSALWMSLTIMLMMVIVYIAVSTTHHALSRSDMVFLCTAGLMMVYQPYVVIFSHYGTTEALMMFVYTCITLLSYLMLKRFRIRYVLSIGFLLGLSTAVKITGLVYALLPGIVVLKHLVHKHTGSLRQSVRSSARIALMIGATFIIGYVISSPHNLLNFDDFIFALSYELGVGDGSLPVFYTQQFAHASPLTFYAFRVFPYLLGGVWSVIALCAMLFVPHTKPLNRLLKISVLSASVIMGTYIKWGRSITPMLPILTVLSIIGIWEIYRRLPRAWMKAVLLASLLGVTVIRGYAQARVYEAPDTRIQASAWIDTNIPEGSTLLTEFGNGHTLPLVGTTMKSYDVREINMYDLDSQKGVQAEFETALRDAQYVVVPSRRVFANYTCQWLGDKSSSGLGYRSDRCERLKESFPLLDAYYADLNDPSKFVLLKTFSSYPRIERAGKILYELKDEHVEEALTVFDHPVVRVYKKVGVH